MNEKKLTDEEIVKALDCCIKECDCENCPYGNNDDCMANVKEILDLIHRLQGEIERLTEELEIEKHNHKATKWFYDNAYKEGLRLLEANKELVKEADKLRDMKFTQEHCDLYKENERRNVVKASRQRHGERYFARV